MVEKKKTLCTKEKVTAEAYDALKECNAPKKAPTVGKEKTKH
jgi:hypothetical protein